MGFLSQNTINGTLASLRITVPEFAQQVLEYVEDGSGYLVFDTFAEYVKDLIDHKASAELISRCFSYVNTICETNDTDILEWLSVTFLESMIQGSRFIEISRQKLRGKSLVLFEEMIASGHWRI